jgi:chloramphenicol O-acetyltransferase type B
MLITKDVEPYAVIGASPAEEIEKLLKLKCWDGSEDKVKENMDFLCGGDVSKL